ncbi:Protein F19G12.2 [Aphelenchoides avenae]|nr:Protein F19G12.2 [Aphelenchus avenae]
MSSDSKESNRTSEFTVRLPQNADDAKRFKRDAQDGAAEASQQEETEAEEDEFADWGGISLTDNEKELIRDLRDQRKELRVRLRRIWDLEEEVEKKKERIKELELENDELPTLRERLTAAEEKRKTDVAAANEVIGQRQTKINELSERITQLESGAQGAEDELRKTNEQRQNYARDVSRLTAEKQQLEREKQKEFDELKARIEALEATEKELQTARQDLEELQIRQKALRGELDAANAESARLAAELQTIRAERVAAEARAQTLQARVDELQRESATLKSTEEERREELAKELRDVREKLTRTENELLSNATQVYNLTAQVSELTKRIASAESAPVAAGTPIDVAEDQAICVANADVARYRAIASHIVLLYDESKGRARIRFDPATMRAVRLSRQLQYVLGFEEPTLTESVSYAKYMPDLHGGVHSLCIYAPGLIEPVMVGDSVAPLLRIAKVKGSPGDMVEDTFLSPQYHKVLEKTLTEISIHIRTATGRPAEALTLPAFPTSEVPALILPAFPTNEALGSSAGREIGREGLATGARILGNLAEGKAARNAVVEETAEGLKNLINPSDPQAALRSLVDKAESRLQQQRGGGRKRNTLTLKQQCSKGRSIDAQSDNALHHALNVFSIPPTNVSVNKAQVRELLPMNPMENSPYEFRIFSDNHWLDLSHTYLYLQLKIEKKKVGEDEFVALGDFDQYVAAINGIEVFDSSTLYPYVAYIKSELYHSPSVKDTWLAPSGFTKDVKRDDQTDAGFFTIYKNDDRFLVQSLDLSDTNEYRVRVHNIRMYVKTVDVQPSLNLTIFNMLEKTPAKYPIRRTQARSGFITVGRTEYTYNVFTNTVPRRLIVAMVANEAYNGKLTKDPFNFRPFNVKEISANVGGLTYPAVPYHLQWRNAAGKHQSYYRPYMDMLDATMANVGGGNTNGITEEMFANGWTIFVIPLTSTLEDHDGFELVRNGTTSLNLKFAEAIPADGGGVELICIGEFDQLLSIDQNRVVITDGAV